jgi:AcrR family transcriptional regulator
MTGHPVEDRRVRRTKNLLHGALASLLHEKPWSRIVVKEILARADVGRSTFYTHFRDKDALLLSGLREIRSAGDGGMRSSDDVERVLGFSLPLFEHIERVRADRRPTLDARSYSPLHAGLQHALVVMIEDELRRTPRESLAQNLAPELVARQITSTFLNTLEWWIDLPRPRPAREADDVFRALAGPVVEAFRARGGASMHGQSSITTSSTSSDQAPRAAPAPASPRRRSPRSA